jgi:hypothetical protein
MAGLPGIACVTRWMRPAGSEWPTQAGGIYPYAVDKVRTAAFTFRIKLNGGYGRLVTGDGFRIYLIEPTDEIMPSIQKVPPVPMSTIPPPTAQPVAPSNRPVPPMITIGGSATSGSNESVPSG